jgi:small-conductance mechanosensitive channel
MSITSDLQRLPAATARVGARLSTMNDTWWWAAGLIAAGLVLGVIASVAARKYLGAAGRRPALREAAGPAATLLFWLFVAAGLIAAVASSSPTTIEDIPSDLLGWLPRLGVAGIILIAGFVIATIASTGVARAASRATGRRQPAVETTVRLGVIAGAVVLALTQLGVDTTILDLLVAATAFGVALALAGIAVVGGRDTARSVAAGKQLSEHLEVGARVTIGNHTGTLQRLTATHAVVITGSGDTAVVAFASIGDVILHPTPDDA